LIEESNRNTDIVRASERCLEKKIASYADVTGIEILSIEDHGKSE